MSDEFLRVATKEVSDDIAEIGNVLKKCQNDNDLSKVATDVEKHVHKLKGLAPMMGQEQIGEISILVDKLLKSIMAGKAVPGIYSTVKDSYEVMSRLINNEHVDFASLKSAIEKNHAHFLH
jgi:chemotaxis protein histidine kinase CheA